MQKNRGCLGCCTTTKLVIKTDEPSKALRVEGRSRTGKKRNIAEELWSSSAYEMNNSAVQSQKSISSISTSNQTQDHDSNIASTSNPPEFINHGLLLWKETRQQWLGNKTSQSKKQVQDPRISWNATYESLLGTNKRFPEPIPLPEMVDFLVDIWEQEGMYD